MDDTDELSDTEIRERLISYGFPSPPVTRTTRFTLLNKLKRLEASEKSTVAVSNDSTVDGITSNLNSSGSSIRSISPGRNKISSPVMRSTPLAGNYTRPSIRNRGIPPSPKVVSTPSLDSSKRKVEEKSQRKRLYKALASFAVIALLVVAHVFLSPITPLHLLGDVKYPLCGLTESQDACVPEERLHVIKSCLRLTAEKLVNIADKVPCSVKLENIQLNYTDALELLIDKQELLRFEADKFLSYTKVVLKHNHFLGIKVLKDKLLYENPPEPMRCVILSYVNCGVTYAFRIFFIIVLLIAGYLLYVWYTAKYSSHRREVNRLVNMVIELLRQNALTNPVNSFLPVDHVRDQLIPPEQRQGKRKVWQEVVRQIKNTESRIREEVQLIAGEDFLVWRWLPKEKSFIK